ncbi:MAG: NADH-ubiquinone oxidoreductase-F iron-sulfur binding region domain-containing protein, partial [Persicimonas sp.]
DLDLLLDMCDNIQGNTICALGDSISIPVRSYLKTFTEEFQEHIDKGCCPYPSWGKDRDEDDQRVA